MKAPAGKVGMVRSASILPRRRFLKRMTLAAGGAVLGLPACESVAPETRVEDQMSAMVREGCPSSPVGPVEPERTLFYTDYLAGGAAPTVALRQMLADAAPPAAPAEVVLDNEGTVELLRNVVVDFPLRLVLEEQSTLRLATEADIEYLYTSRHSGYAHAGMLHFLNGASGSELQFYGHLDPNHSNIVRREGDDIAVWAIKLRQAHDVHVDGDWTFGEAVAGVGVVDSDRVQAYGFGSAVTNESFVGKGGSTLGFSGCCDLHAGRIWGRNRGEIVDSNGGNYNCVVDGIEAENVKEVADTNNSRNITYRNVKAKNCAHVISMFNNSGAHTSERPDIPKGERGQMTIENVDIVYDQDFSQTVEKRAVTGTYSEESIYRNIAFNIRGADPARFTNQLCLLQSEGGEIEVKYESDVPLDVPNNFQFGGRSAEVRFTSQAPIAYGRAAMIMQGDVEEMNIVSPHIRQTGAGIDARGRTGIDLSGASDVRITDPDIEVGHFELPIHQ